MRPRIVWGALGSLAIVLFVMFRSNRTSNGMSSQTANEHRDSQPAEDELSGKETPALHSVSRGSFAAKLRASHAASASQETLLQRLLAQDAAVTEVSTEHIEAFLAANKTNAASLLAAWQAGGGREYLKKAAAMYPNDPKVQFSVVALELFPEEQRKWLDRLKESAPDNALPYYLSAKDYLQSNQPELALKELTQAASLNRFDDYRADKIQDLEELHLLSGKTPAEAKAVAGMSLLLPQLKPLKELSQSMGTLIQQHVAANDTRSAETLAQLGWELGRGISAGGDSRSLIDQLVGLAIQRNSLSKLPPETQPNFLTTNARDTMTGIDAQRNELRELNASFETWLGAASENDVINYFDRVKINGERAALIWLKQKLGH